MWIREERHFRAYPKEPIQNFRAYNGIELTDVKPHSVQVNWYSSVSGWTLGEVVVTGAKSGTESDMGVQVKLVSGVKKGHIPAWIEDVITRTQPQEPSSHVVDELKYQETGKWPNPKE